MIVLLTLLIASCVNALGSISLAEFKAHPIPKFAESLEGQDLVDYINIVQPFFTANLSAASEHQLLDEKFLSLDSEERAEEIPINVDIPESYDARTAWPQCNSIKIIRDQSKCGSCWAVSAASAMSDRLCVQSKGAIQTMVSDADILSCCGSFCGYGCNGGYPIRAWQYIVSTGTCSGGPYNTKGVCKPYPFRPCGWHKGQGFHLPCLFPFSTPECKKECQKGFTKKYEEDKIYGKKAYAVQSSVEAIQKEIMINGPVQAGFIVYSDFSFYKKGIYVHTAGMKQGGHAVKIIGWGVEKDTPYWLIANSWNYDWGENGTFRMVRGRNECGIEQMIVAGSMVE
ncbi:papain family cysteine protease [Oesophagostomum dentatum]|uniref:Papain family cysteine protease n=1 Tax=Oesophagostomum dentatum TaxID=61180 RepID=A0A0B1TU64_OESDE|nr:papain family cysteine protease [Oesophagostomum dentatum]